MKRFSIALVISTLYLFLGNAAAIGGMSNPSNEFLNSPLVEIIFAPYTFMGGMSAFAGWDLLSFISELVIFILTIPFFYLLVTATKYILNKF